MLNIAHEMFDREINDLAFHDLLGAHDPMLDGINQQLTHEISTGAPGGRLCFDALALQAGVHLLRHYATVQFKPLRLRHAKTPLRAQWFELHGCIVAQ